MVATDPNHRVPWQRLLWDLLLPVSQWALCAALDALAGCRVGGLFGCERVLSQLALEQLLAYRTLIPWPAGKCAGGSGLSILAGFPSSRTSANKMGRLRCDNCRCRLFISGTPLLV